jgi:hypothetical protein
MRGWRRWRTGVLLGMAVLVGAAAEGVRAVGPSPAGAAMGGAPGGPEAVGAAPRGAPAGDPVARVGQEAGTRMEEAMSAPGSGDTDRDLAVALIARYRGTIDAAAPLVEHGRDPALKELAGDLVELQRRQIEFPRDWLAAHPG